MATDNVALEMHRGDDRTWDFTLTRAGKTLNIAGGSVAFSARRRVSSLTADITKALTITDGPNGQCRLNLVATDTSTLYAPLVLLFDIELTLGGLKSTQVTGTLLIKADLTHA